MTSRKPRIKGLPEIAQPRTQLEEILFVVESTNDIVSKILEIHEKQKARKLKSIELLTKILIAIGEIGK